VTANSLLITQTFAVPNTNMWIEYVIICQSRYPARLPRPLLITNENTMLINSHGGERTFDSTWGLIITPRGVAFMETTLFGAGATWRKYRNVFYFLKHDLRSPKKENYCRNVIASYLRNCFKHKSHKMHYRFQNKVLRGLFDRASSSWNNLKCQLDATR